MREIDGHRRVVDVAKKQQKLINQVIAAAFNRELSLAVWAAGFFVAPATIKGNGRFKRTGEFRMCGGEWLFVDRRYLLQFCSDDSVGMGIFRSGPDTDADLVMAKLKNNRKIQVKLSELWMPVDALPEIQPGPSAPLSSTDRTPSEDERERRAREIAELRKEAIRVAVKLLTDGMDDQYITVKRVCEYLLDKNFSDGTPFTSRWRKIEGMRAKLHREHHPKNSQEYRRAKAAAQRAKS